MSKPEKVRRLRLSRSRRLTIDVLHYNRKVPTCAHDRRCDLSRVAELRARLPVRVSWSVLFIKAFSLVAARRNVLRQAYVSWPWPHVVEHPDSVGMLATHREHQGDPWVFWSRFFHPETQPLIELQQRLDRYLSGPVEQVFSAQWRLSGVPTLLRRMFWWYALNVEARQRARRVGTFFLTTLAGKGVEIQDPPAFLTSNLTYGPLDETGHSRVTISYDHRLMDGAYVADCLIELEQVLNGEIARELEMMIEGTQVDAA